MVGTFGFSYNGMIYLLMLWVPNSLWTRRLPEGYDPSRENKILLALERIGQVLSTASVLLFTNYNPQIFEPWTTWLILSEALMLLYEIFWIRYFPS